MPLITINYLSLGLERPLVLECVVGGQKRRQGEGEAESAEEGGEGLRLEIAGEGQSEEAHARTHTHSSTCTHLPTALSVSWGFLTPSPLPRLLQPADPTQGRCIHIGRMRRK